MTAVKKSHEYSEYGSFEQLLFLFSISITSSMAVFHLYPLSVQSVTLLFMIFSLFHFQATAGVNYVFLKTVN